MRGTKEPIAGVFVLLLLAAGGWAAQEPFPHFGSDITPDSQMSEKVRTQPVQSRQLAPDNLRRFSNAGATPDYVHAVAGTRCLPSPVAKV
ncbi:MULTISPECIES: hypothetical protein [Pseudomonas]|uniref:hypothetical protein n=1 Tax=Pseudomonas TaxID=286 RepID=UPI001E44B681|nr:MULTISPECIES: hypothetical protein [Pseudomonas]MCD5983990.1 hypothetical protein [Pseudomonas sp. CDFA 610]MCQ9473520.1 hypothetical protein [Pseudomonas alliivorans]